MADESKREDNPSARRLTRREALTRLGLAAGASYVAPTLIGLNQAAAQFTTNSSGLPPWAGGPGGKSKNKSSKGKGD